MSFAKKYPYALLIFQRPSLLHIIQCSHKHTLHGKRDTWGNQVMVNFWQLLHVTSLTICENPTSWGSSWEDGLRPRNFAAVHCRLPQHTMWTHREFRYCCRGAEGEDCHKCWRFSAILPFDPWPLQMESEDLDLNSCLIRYVNNCQNCITRPDYLIHCIDIQYSYWWGHHPQDYLP